MGIVKQSKKGDKLLIDISERKRGMQISQENTLEIVLSEIDSLPLLRDNFSQKNSRYATEVYFRDVEEGEYNLAIVFLRYKPSNPKNHIAFEEYQGVYKVKKNHHQI